MTDDWKCTACDGQGLVSNATHELQAARVAAAIAEATEQDRRWRLAAEVVLERATVQGMPALTFIAKVVALGEKVAR